ncbi:MAG: N-acetylglucosamine-6-phosphate deacetylase [Lentisphaeria bacterium]|nr:N-acetylglucosamine-6-phosphate deacetylase [Lentisphaeria bacterium]
MSMLLKNIRLVSPDVDEKNAAILVADGKVADVFCDGDALPSVANVVDGQGLTAVPGFIDVHCHGRSGVDFCDATQEAMDTIAMDKLSEGVTTLLPTTLTLPEDQLAAAMQTAKAYVAKGALGCKVPGVHLEGPFINPKCLGAQNPDFVRTPDVKEVMRLNEIFPVKKVSYAVEMENGPRFAAELLANGITPSCVHSAATYAGFMDAYRHGLRNLSHFCNQMTALHHRDIGLVGAGLMHNDVFIEFICDKLHICPDMIKLVFQIKGTEHIQLITDAMRASGLPDGPSDLGGLPVIVKNGEARLASNGALAGSTLQMATALKNITEVTGLPLKETVKCTSWNQARALNMTGLGKLAPGYAADIVLMDEAFQVKQVFVDGTSKFSAN